MIKIISNVEHPGNQKLSMLNLCKLFNNHNHKCELYFPTGNFSKETNVKSLFDFKADKNDIIIVNDISLTSYKDLFKPAKLFSNNCSLEFKIKNLIRYFVLSSKHPFKKLILVTHDQNFDKKQKRKLKLSIFDEVINDKNFFSTISDIADSKNEESKIAGIADDICRKNKIKELINLSLQDDMKKIILFGHLKDPSYYYNEIAPILSKNPNKILFAGFNDHRQAMYDLLTDVYSNNGLLIAKESKQAKVSFHSLSKNDEKLLSNDEVYGFWKQKLEL